MSYTDGVCVQVIVSYTDGVCVQVTVSYTDGVCVVFQQQVRRRIWHVQHVQEFGGLQGSDS